MKCGKCNTMIFFEGSKMSLLWEGDTCPRCIWDRLDQDLEDAQKVRDNFVYKAGQAQKDDVKFHKRRQAAISQQKENDDG